jgi:hypothetical protein
MSIWTDTYTYILYVLPIFLFFSRKKNVQPICGINEINNCYMPLLILLTSVMTYKM